MTVLLEIFESVTYHFVEDGHYNCFDDMYSPDYVCQSMMKAIIDAVKSGSIPAEEVQRLREGLDKLKHTETYENYGVPYALYMWEKFRKTNLY